MRKKSKLFWLSRDSYKHASIEVWGSKAKMSDDGIYFTHDGYVATECPGEFYNLTGIDPVEGSLKAEYDKISGLLRISYTSNDPVKAKEVSIEAYKLIQSRFESLVVDYAMEEKKILEKKLEETREALLTLEYKIRLFQNEHGS